MGNSPGLRAYQVKTYSRDWVVSYRVPILVTLPYVSMLGSDVKPFTYEFKDAPQDAARSEAELMEARASRVPVRTGWLGESDKDLQAKAPLRPETKKQKATRYAGKVCSRHPELNGVRLLSNSRCVACNSDKVATRRSEPGPLRERHLKSMRDSARRRRAARAALVSA